MTTATRRQFLKGAALTVGALAIPAFVLPAVSETVHEPTQVALLWNGKEQMRQPLLGVIKTVDRHGRVVWDAFDVSFRAVTVTADQIMLLGADDRRLWTYDIQPASAIGGDFNIIWHPEGLSMGSLG